MKTILVIALLLAGCTTIDTQVKGWPQDMKTEVHTVSLWEIQKQCWPDLPWYWKAAGGIALQCTHLDLNANTCDIYTMGTASEHELDHCKGGDHDGLLQKTFDRWQAAKGNRS